MKLVVKGCLVATGALLVASLIVWYACFTRADRAVLLAGHRVLRHDGHERTYLVVEPPRAPESIVLVLHGLAGTGRRIAYYSAMHNVVGDRTLVVYPNALPPDRPDVYAAFNAGFCCGSGLVTGADDTGFLLRLLDHVGEAYGIEDPPVFVTGFSGGAFMTQRLLAEFPNRFAGGASVAGSIGRTDQHLAPTRPVPILLVHGQRDKKVPYEGGPGESYPDFVWMSFDQTAEAWQTANGCPEITTTEDSPVLVARGCGDGQARYEEVVFRHAGHAWPGWRFLKVWSSRPAASIRITDFMRRVRDGGLPSG